MGFLFFKTLFNFMKVSYGFKLGAAYNFLKGKQKQKTKKKKKKKGKENVVQYITNMKFDKIDVYKTNQ